MVQISTLRTGVRGKCTDFASCEGLGVGLGLIWERGWEPEPASLELLELHQTWGGILG